MSTQTCTNCSAYPGPQMCDGGTPCGACIQSGVAAGCAYSGTGPAPKLGRPFKVKCTFCRRRHFICDGKRPSCTQCATNSSEPCVYLPQDTDASATGKKKSDHPQASGSKARSQSHRVNPYPRHPSDRNVGPYPPSTSGHRRPSAGSGPDQYPSNPYYASGSRQGTNTTPHTTPYSTPSTTQYTSPYTAGSQYLMPTTQLAGYGGTNPSMIPPPPVGYGGGSGPFPQYSPASAQTPGSTQPHALRAPRQASRSPEFVCICGNYPRNPNACFCNQDAYDVGPYIAEKERERRERERGHE